MKNAHHWNDCPYCQDRTEYVLNDDSLVCSKCKNSIDYAHIKENLRPQLFSLRPKALTAGSLMELTYRCESNEPPPFITIIWAPNNGQTSVRFKNGDWRKDSYGYAISIEIPPGSTTATIRDASKKSKQVVVEIEYESQRANQKKLGLKKLFGLSD